MSVAIAMIDDVTGFDSAPTPLVGRSSELATLLTAVGVGGVDERSDRPNVVLIGGDAGIGKTRLIRELAGRARTDALRVLVGHCVARGGDAMPYLPITEAFGRLARDEPDLVEQLRAAHPPLDRLLPRRTPTPAASDGRLDRGELFEAILATVLDLAGDARLLVIIEDLHWADETTRDLVGFLATRLSGEPVTIVGTFRSDDMHRKHPLRGPLLEWGRLPAVSRLTLGPLAASEVTTLLRTLDLRERSDARDHDAADAAPVTFARQLADIVARADGNAFFAEQLLAESAQSGAAALPADLADLLLLRLERLSGAAREVVRIVAVAGRQTTHEWLTQVSSCETAELDEAIREAVDAHVLERRPGDLFVFRHALLAEAVYDDLLPGERVRLHAAFATVLRCNDGDDAELARHASEAGDAVTAYHAALRAAEHAMRVAAPAEARTHYLAAMSLAPRVDDARPAYQLALDAAEATDLAGHPFQAIRLVEQAIAALPDGDDEHRAQLLVALLRYSLPWDVGDTMLASSREALALIPAEPPSELRATAMGLHARALSHHDDPATVAWATQARAMAQLLGVADVAVDAAIVQSKAERRAGAYASVEATLDQSRDEAVAAGDLAAELRVLHSIGLLRQERGDTAGATRAWDDAIERGADGGRPWATYAMDSRVHSVRAHIMLGDWDAALRLSDAASLAPPEFAAAALRAVSAVISAARGERDADVSATSTRSWWAKDAMIVIDAGSALIESAYVAGDPDRALDALRETLAFAQPMWGRSFQAQIRMNAQTLMVLADSVADASEDVRKARYSQAQQLIDEIARVVSANDARGVAVGVESSAWQQRAGADLLFLRWRAGIESPETDELIEAWMRAVAAAPAAGVYEVGRSQARLATVLQAAGRRADAQRIADEARAAARQLGAQRLLADLAQLSRPSAAADNDGSPELTPREQQVLTLLAVGRTNRQIGRELFISDKTVSVHVSNLLAKLGASGRTEAAAIARRDGLLP